MVIYGILVWTQTVSHLLVTSGQWRGVAVSQGRHIFVILLTREWLHPSSTLKLPTAMCGLHPRLFVVLKDNFLAPLFSIQVPGGMKNERL